VLTLLVGRSAVERAKAGVIAVLLTLLALSLWLTSAGRAAAVGEQRDRSNAVDIATRFGAALTTYDYAHRDVQMSLVVLICSRSVCERVAGAFADIAAAKASSIGDVMDATVINQTSTQIEVLLRTSQVVTSSYEAAATELTGWLHVSVGRSRNGWVVIDYRWLLAPSGAP
jgi:hypothetical protein